MTLQATGRIRIHSQSVADTKGSLMWFEEFRPYVPVAQRKAQAAREMAKRRKNGADGLACRPRGPDHCAHLLGQGLVRQPGVLQRLREPLAARPHIRPQRLGGGPADSPGQGQGDWSAAPSFTRSNHHRAAAGQGSGDRIKSRCAGQVGSLVELLQGKLSNSVIDIVTARGAGLFPKPSEIEMSCSCPDWAGMCKHVAAVMYGVGARLDHQPELLFRLRKVDHLELIRKPSLGPARRKRSPGRRRSPRATWPGCSGSSLRGRKPLRPPHRSRTRNPSGARPARGSRPRKTFPPRRRRPARLGPRRKPRKRRRANKATRERDGAAGTTCSATPDSPRSRSGA